MQSRTSILSAFTLSSGMAFGAAAIAADLPKSGTIKTHIGLKENSVAVPVGGRLVREHHRVGDNNDAGNGPLHTDAWNSRTQWILTTVRRNSEVIALPATQAGWTGFLSRSRVRAAAPVVLALASLPAAPDGIPGSKANSHTNASQPMPRRASTIARSNSTISYNNLSSKSLNRR
jgi:hypothetical protein